MIEIIGAIFLGLVMIAFLFALGFRPFKLKEKDTKPKSV